MDDRVIEHKEVDKLQHRFREQLVALIEVANELATTESFDSLCRRAVELGRSRLGFDRLGIWFRYDEPDTIVGSFGVDEDGNICDERSKKTKLDLDMPCGRILLGKEPFVFESELPVTNYKGEVVSQASHAFAGIWDGKDLIGYISMDNLITKDVVTTQQCELLRLFASTIGHLVARKRVEERLKQSELKFRTIFENAGGAIFIADINTEKILECNSQAEKLLGRTRAEIIGIHQSELHPEGEAEKYKEKFSAHVQQGHIVNYEGEVQHKDGRRIPVWIAAQTMKIDSKDIIVGLFVDITERKQAEKELEQFSRQLEASVERANLLAQEATVADLAKSQFLANMSHEIRTPMNAIIGFSQILAEENLTDEQRLHIDIIRQSAEHLLELINDILDFSKIEAGKLNIEIVDCSLEHLFAGVESLMRLQAKEKGIAFEILQCGRLPAQICTDPVRLHQCLINLINNAIKFTEEGHVYVNVFLQEVDNEPFIRFDVEDTGIGIPPDKLELIFEEFQQGDGSDTRQYTGTGLGLAITKKLARLLDGELTVSSEVGKGSVFSLIIPANVDVKSQPLFQKYDRASELTRSADIKGYEQFVGRVLIAEDTKSNQVLIKLLLERFGAEVTIAEDGKEAVDKALTEQFDLIFMDIQMPHTNGYEATKELRKEGITTPIVALTANAMKGDDQKCIEAGCDDYLAKPIDNKLLLTVIKKYLIPQSEPLTERIDSAKSEVDRLSRQCSDGASQECESAGPLEEKDGETPVDCTAVMKNYQDEELIKKVVKVVLAEAPKIMEDLIEAVRASDSDNILFYAHKLGGLARNICARQLSKKAHELECAVRKGDMEHIASPFDEIQCEFEKVLLFLSKEDCIEGAKHRQENGQAELLVTNSKTLE